MLFRSIELPGLSVPGNLWLAPMAGYTDTAFRSVCLEQGAVLAFTEMASAEALSRGSTRTLELLKRAEGEQLLCLQLFASEPRSIRGAVEAVRPLRPALIDLNCGCSVPKILRTGCGAALLRASGRIAELVHALREESGLPVSVKIRSGWDSGSINFLEVAEAARRAGACLVTLHPRTRAQGFTGRADLEHLRSLKMADILPVIGSGDLFCAEDARAMLSRTGCDGVMFARGAIGQPFIFRSTRALLTGAELPPEPSARERLHAALAHLGLAVDDKGEAVACRQMRKHFGPYTRGLPGAAELRQQAVRAEGVQDYRRLVDLYLEHHPCPE